MAGDWIKIEVCTPDKPEVVRISNILAIDQDTVVGKLFRVWAWANQQSLDGNALSVTEMFIDRITHCTGFAAALAEVHWMNIGPDGLSFPNFDRHNGQTAKNRAVTNKRVAIHRQKKTPKCNGGVTQPPLQKALPEKRREESKTPIVPKGTRRKQRIIQDDPKFTEFWNLIPNGIGKGKAREAWDKATSNGTTADEIIAGVPSYHAYEKKRSRQVDYRPLHPATWLNQRRWEDEGNEYELK